MSGGPHGRTDSLAGLPWAGDEDDSDSELWLCIRNTFLDVEVVRSSGLYRCHSWSSGQSSNSQSSSQQPESSSTRSRLFPVSSTMQLWKLQRASMASSISQEKKTQKRGSRGACESGLYEAMDDEEPGNEPRDQTAASEGGVESGDVCPLCRQNHTTSVRPAMKRRMALKAKAHKIAALPDGEVKLDLIRTLLAGGGGAFACSVLTAFLSDETLSRLMKPENDP
eukprot:TRINITY_DN6702_c0_g1_i1.p1 TRINITY_DN6702_c0_g1~~TRINITY_DN6702_c0_g1_i1.p1  ORF type:complete len:224 (+),score=29.98 TRINITY_DN6702_c0_g1_i1:64-735(+)